MLEAGGYPPRFDIEGIRSVLRRLYDQEANERQGLPIAGGSGPRIRSGE